MYDYQTYKLIQEYKKAGLNRNQVKTRLNMSYATVTRYWNMTEEEYEKNFKEIHKRELTREIDQYEQDVLEMLRESPKMTYSEIYERLWNTYGPGLKISDELIRQYVYKFRIENEKGE